MDFKQVNLKAPRKAFKKVKETNDVLVVSTISFEAMGVDDETLMRLAMLSESGAPVTITIEAGAFLT